MRPFHPVMILELFLMLDDLAVELVDQPVDGGIHIFLDVIGKQAVAADHHCRLSLVTQLLNRQYDVGIDYLIEMPFQALKFISDILAQRASDVEVMPGEIDLHIKPLLLVKR